MVFAVFLRPPLHHPNNTAVRAHDQREATKLTNRIHGHGSSAGAPNPLLQPTPGPSRGGAGYVLGHGSRWGRRWAWRGVRRRRVAASASRAGGRRKEERKGELEWAGPRVGRDREGWDRGGHFPFACHADQLRWRATPIIMVKMYRFSLSTAKIVSSILNLLYEEWPSVMVVKS